MEPITWHYNEELPFFEYKANSFEEDDCKLKVAKEMPFLSI